MPFALNILDHKRTILIKKIHSLFPPTAFNSCTFVSFRLSRTGRFHFSSGQNAISTLIKCLLNCLFGVFTPLSFILYCSLRKTTSTYSNKPQTSGLHWNTSQHMIFSQSEKLFQQHVLRRKVTGRRWKATCKNRFAGVVLFVRADN